MNFADVEMLAKASGFIVAMNEGDLLTLPAGHIIVNYVKEDSVYIKWSTYAKSDRSQVESDIASLMAAHEFLAGTDYKKLYDIIQADVQEV
jgi:uncharacterized cupin superfamily protein